MLNLLKDLKKRLVWKCTMNTIGDRSHFHKFAMRVLSHAIKNDSDAELWNDLMDGAKNYMVVANNDPTVSPNNYEGLIYMNIKNNTSFAIRTTEYMDDKTFPLLIVNSHGSYLIKDIKEYIDTHKIERSFVRKNRVRLSHELRSSACGIFNLAPVRYRSFIYDRTLYIVTLFAFDTHIKCMLSDPLQIKADISFNIGPDIQSVSRDMLPYTLEIERLLQVLGDAYTGTCDYDIFY